MKFDGLADAPGASANTAPRCPECGSLLRVAHGLCATCLMHGALDAEESADETLGELLTDVPLSDADWRLGNYQVLEEIARGGMGVIYRARQRHSRRIVALKRVFHHQADCRETLKRFRREVEAAASLDHPNILPIYEVGETDGVPFFSMKFAAGGTLASPGADVRGDPRRCVSLMAKVARAVAFAHSHGILHRDLKPGNILLDAKGEPMVGDFGLAKWIDARSDLTRTRSIFGTPGYLAPEQASDSAAQLQPASDVYSLGAILFDLLTGRPPFQGDHVLAVLRSATEKPAPRLRILKPSLDRDLETICARCLEQEPSARYQSADELADDLDRWLTNRPIHARPVSPPTRIWRWCRRNQNLATAAALCILLAVAVVWLAKGRLEFERVLKRSTHSKPHVLDVPEKSVAVLPFESLGDTQQKNFLAEGIQEDVLKDLSKIADLKVISSASVQSYRPELARDLHTIAESLGVRYLVQGSVRRERDRIRVAAQLIDASTGARRWSEHYDRALANFFDIKAELAQAIAHQLRAHITPPERAEIQEPATRDIEAYDLYQEGRVLSNGSYFSSQIGPRLLQAVRLLQQAISRDPHFVAAYCELVSASDRLYVIGFDHTPERLSVGEQAIKAILRLRPNSGAAHLALAQHLYWGHLDYDGARRELLLAQKALPNDANVLAMQAYIDRRQGRWKEATNELIRALELNPRAFDIQQETALTLLSQRRFLEVATVLDRALAIMPGHAATRILQSAIPYERLGDTRPFRDTIEAIVTAEPKMGPQIAEYWFRLGMYERDLATIEQAVAVMAPEGLAVDSVRFPRSWCEAIAARMRGDVSLSHRKLLEAREQVEKTIQQQPNFPVMLSVLGVIDANLGRREMAIAEGKRAVDLVPLSKDAINGEHAIVYLAIIYAWTGEKDLAFQQLQLAASIPSDISYGYLLLDPAWDPLRGDPRFDKIVASLAPKPGE